MQFELSEKFRAETWRHIGYIWCTPVCSLVFFVIIQSEFRVSLQNIFFAILLFVAGYSMVHSSYTFLYRIDEKRSFNDRNNS